MQAALEDKGIKHVLNLVGNQHKYQIRATIMIALQYLGPSLFLAYLPFFDQSPTFLCLDEDGSFSKCYENSGGCQFQQISPDTPNSPALDFGLYCNRAYMRSWTQLCIAGMVGAGLFSFISDYFGRKKAMFFSYALITLSIFSLAMATFSHIVFNALFKLVGLGIGGYISISITYLSEIGSEKFGRKASGVVLLVVAAGGLVITGLIYTGLRWRLLFLYFIGVPTMLALFSFNYLDETPMFLYRNKDIGKTLQTLEKMATMNNKLTDLGANIEANGIFRFADDSETERPKRYIQRWHYLQILKHPQLKYRVLIYSLIRFFASLPFLASFYTLLTQNGRSLTVMALASVAEILGGLWSCNLMKLFVVNRSIVEPSVLSARFQLKTCLLGIFVASACLWEVYALRCQDPPFIFPVLLLNLRFYLARIRRFIYNLGNELFPVEVRSQCNGIGEIFGQSAGPLISVIFNLATQENFSILWFIVSAAVLVCLGLRLLLPKEDLTTLEKDTEIELNLDDNPRIDSQPLIAN